jgi:hypothetical protein
VWCLWWKNGTATGFAPSRYFGLPLSVSFHECSVLIFVFEDTFDKRAKGEAWEPTNKSYTLSEMRSVRKEKFFPWPAFRVVKTSTFR